jgi:hypothetical protein
VKADRWKSQYNVKDNSGGPFPCPLPEKNGRFARSGQLCRHSRAQAFGKTVRDSVMLESKAINASRKRQVKPLGELDEAPGRLAQKHD